MPEQFTHLDTLPPIDCRIGYGNLGTGGALGYEGKNVLVRDRSYPRALSMHAPARMLFKIDRRFSAFESQVAINDDVTAGHSSADFTVWADGRLVGSALGVAAGEPPRLISADVESAHILELAVNAIRRDFCHSVWLDPRLQPVADGQSERSRGDCLERCEILLPSRMPQADKCIATVASPGFESFLDDLLGSLAANGGCSDALIVVFIAGESSTLAPIVAKYRARSIHIRPRAKVGTSLKSVLYSTAQVVNARQYLCLDADMLVLGDLRSLFAAIDACPDHSLLVCREQSACLYKNLGDVFQLLYRGNQEEASELLDDSMSAYPLIVNDGLFAGSRSAMLGLDTTLRSMAGLRAWMDSIPDFTLRNQFLFNAALARTGCGVEVHPIYNLQLNRFDVQVAKAGLAGVEWNGTPVRIVHFNGDGRQRHPELRGHYSRVADPLQGPAHPDLFGCYLKVLRAWIGVHGLRSMAWSFYGMVGAHTAFVADTAMPLLALLHYLVRSNGCVRVFETGTARGVSAACLASAVAHRAGAQVVSFDPCICPEREALWSALPEPMRSCLEARIIGSIEGMTAALADGEVYEAALLDSIHTAEHVWAEFELARRLVCPGGLILVHDARCSEGTVEPALRRIQFAGYGVVRLWTAEAGVAEDSGLGLAVIENRVPGGDHAGT